MIFEWSERKAAVNLAKHGVSFSDAATLFADALALTFVDAEHSVSRSDCCPLVSRRTAGPSSCRTSNETGASGSFRPV
jgi:uncharacterized DUF497 family protein